jgi:protein-arginine kinase activator protein McsA
MDDLMDLINAQDELTQVEYKINRLQMIEEEYVENEEYEKAQMILNEQKRLRRRRTILKKKLQT